MFIPEGYTESQIVAIIDRQVALISPSFAFGYISQEDVAQEARVFAIELLNKGTFDPQRPLENYLFVHLKRRLINMHRNLVRRADAPCKECHSGTPCQGKHYCKKYEEWFKRNNDKSNLIRPLDINHVSDEHEPRTHEKSTVETEVEINECLELIDKHLPVELRSTYLKMREGAKVTKAKRMEVEGIIKNILKGALDES